MPLTFEQLTATKTKEDWKEGLLLALKGVGFIAHDGTGTATWELSGRATDSSEIVLEVTGSGALGAATYSVTHDGAVVDTGTIPSDGVIDLGLGVSVAFSAGPSGTTSFVDGDAYTLNVDTPNFD